MSELRQQFHVMAPTLYVGVTLFQVANGLCYRTNNDKEGVTQWWL